MATPLVPANFEAEMAREAEEIRKRIAAPTGDKIRTNGSKEFLTPDGGSGETLTGVIVDFVSMNSYYDTPFQQDTPSAPACFAIGLEPSLLAPSPNSPVKQNDTCAPCPQNQFGSARGGGKGKACRNMRLLALMPATENPPALNEDPGDPAPVWVLAVPPTSIKAFDAYVSNLRARKTVPNAVVTRVSMDPSITYTNLKFDAVRALAPEELGRFRGRQPEALDRLMTEPDVSQYQPPKKTRR